MSDFVKVARTAEVPPGSMKGVQVNGVPVVLCNVDGTVYALRDECTHEAFPLSDGMLDGTRLTCALHGAQFDCATGRVRALPAIDPVRTFEVKVDGDEIYIRGDLKTDGA